MTKLQKLEERIRVLLLLDTAPPGPNSLSRWLVSNGGRAPLRHSKPISERFDEHFREPAKLQGALQLIKWNYCVTLLDILKALHVWGEAAESQYRCVEAFIYNGRWVGGRPLSEQSQEVIDFLYSVFYPDNS